MSVDVSNKDVDAKDGEVRYTVTNINYDLEGMFGFERYVGKDVTKEQILEELPTTDFFDFGESSKRIDCESDILKFIENETGWLCSSFDYEVKGKKYFFVDGSMAEWLLRQPEDFQNDVKVFVEKWDQEQLDKVNDLAKEASVKDQYDRYVDVELEVGR